MHPWLAARRMMVLSESTCGRVLLYDSLAYDLQLSHEISLWCFLETTSVYKAFLFMIQ